MQASKHGPCHSALEAPGVQPDVCFIGQNWEFDDNCQLQPKNKNNISSPTFDYPKKSSSVILQ